MRQKRLAWIVSLSTTCIVILSGVAYAGDVGVAHYAADLTIRPEGNAVETRVSCTIRNDGSQTIRQLSFDLLAREQRCRARTTIGGIWQHVDGELIAVTFQQDAGGEGTSGRKLTHVTLASGLAPAATAKLVFEYTWHATDPTNVRDNYRPFATLPDGDKQVCLLSDLAWLPVVKTQEELRSASQANRFARTIKPSWTIRVTAPSDYTAVALGGRHVRTEKHNDTMVSQWRSTVPFFPQLIAGAFRRQAVSFGSGNVVFYLPKGWHSDLIPEIGRKMAEAYNAFVDLFGPLEGDEIHIAVSSAGQGGHAGYLSFTMDTNMLGQQITAERLPMIMEIIRHELAHSWWGWSVSSYDMGTKFLRESLAGFANAYYVEQTDGEDRFTADMAKLFWMGFQGDILCGPQADSERAAYMKGPVVLNVLRMEMGDVEFFKMLKHFASKYQGGHATMTDFVAACNETTNKDWAPFFEQWCFSAGVPDYRVETFKSEQSGTTWATHVTVRNAGAATIACPLALRMNGESTKRTFRVEPGATKTLTCTTPSRVTAVVIDPAHRTYQGSGRECRLKMLGVGKVNMEWIWYWRGVVLAEEQRYDEAISDISRAMKAHGHPAFSYSRGIAYLKKGDVQAARADLVDFLDAVTNSNDPRRSLVYPGLLSPDANKQWDQINGILQALTGQSLTDHEHWRTWWKANRQQYQPAPGAGQLGPGGLPAGERR